MQCNFIYLLKYFTSGPVWGTLSPYFCSFSSIFTFIFQLYSWTWNMKLSVINSDFNLFNSSASQTLTAREQPVCDSLSGSSSTADLQVVLLDQNFTTDSRSVQQSIHSWSITQNREGSWRGGNKEEEFSFLSHNYDFLCKK